MTEPTSAQHLGPTDEVFVLLEERWLPGTVLMARGFSDGTTWLKVCLYDESGFRTDLFPEHLCRRRAG